MFMILFVLHDPDQITAVLSAWEECGVSGVTILPSTGLGRFRNKVALQDDFPLIPSLNDLLQHEEAMNRTLFSVVDSQAMVDRVVNATQSVTGDLDLPNTGILLVLPVVQAYGLHRKNK
jgi:nitrogen regulatory protein P-II 1